MTAAAMASAALTRVLATQWAGEPGVVVESPAGAGKTYLVELLAVQAVARLRERCMVTTQTNEQAFDLAGRLARRCPGRDFLLLTKAGLVLPDALAACGNLRVIHTVAAVPAGPCVVVANAAKWATLGPETAPFDLQVVDEAFQLPDYRFQQIANLASRFLLVGDPGQIAPVITCDVARWQADPAGPHVASPQALLARHPALPRLTLPVSRRLPPDTVALLQPAFYPRLPFRSLTEPGARGLRLRPAGAGPLDRGLDLAAAGRSLVALELPAAVTGEVDEALAETIVRLMERLLARETVLCEDGRETPLVPAMLGVVCAHVAQVNAVASRLPPQLSEVFVETAERFQGLERPLIFVHHPLSGRVAPSAFQVNAGRLCVMLSRHRIACWLVTRAGVDTELRRAGPSGDRVLGSRSDPEFEGWQAHRQFLQALRATGRIIPL